MDKDGDTLRRVDRAVSLGRLKLGLDYAFEGRRKQLGREEEVVYTSWLADQKDSYSRFGTNVPLWWSIPCVEGVDGLISYGDMGNPEYRLDAIADNGRVVSLIEVKVVAGMGAIGQLLCYRELYMRTYDTNKPTLLLLVCTVVKPVVKEVCGYVGIEVVIV